MNTRMKMVCAILVVLLVSVGCSIFPASVNQQDIINTAVAKSKAEILSQFPTPLPTQAPVVIVLTSVPPTALPYMTPIPSVPTPTYVPCSSAMAYDLNYPDYTYVDLNQSFSKAWVFTNVGSCTWSTSYHVAFMSGYQMNGPAYQYLTNYVSPGGSIQVTLPLQAPSTAGTYTGYWGIYDNYGQYFGKVWVTINAGTTSYSSSSFAVTSVSLSTDHPTTWVPGVCPSTVNYYANVTANMTGTVTYHWVYPDASVGPTLSLYFGAAGTQTISTPYSAGTTGVNHAYSASLYIDNPNHQLFGPVVSYVTLAACP